MISLRLAVLALLPCGMVSTPALSQDDFQQWLSASVKINLTDRIEVGNETIARFSDEDGGLYEIEDALMLGYGINDAITVSAGYVHNPQYDSGRFREMERRAREQISFDDFAAIGALSFSGRLRFEQRWRDGIAGTAWRFRPHVKAALPLRGKGGASLLLSVEPFINLSETVFQPSAGLERTRSAIAVSIPLATAVKLEAGYLNQHRFIRGGRDTDDHALTLSLGLAF